MHAKRRIHFCLWLTCAIAFVFVAATPAGAYVSFETTVSGGYFRDLQQRAHAPVSLYWTLNHSTDSDVHTLIDLGANDLLIPNTWGFYLYQAYISIPLSSGFAEAPGRVTRIQLGRQLFTEGFEYDTLDGAVMPIQVSPRASLWLSAGTLSSIDAPETDFHTQLYGGSFHGYFPGWLGPLGNAQWVAGYFYKRRDDQDANLLHASLNQAFSGIPGSPNALVRAQWRLSDPSNFVLELDQFLGEVDFYPADRWQVELEYSSREPNVLDLASTQLIYELFSISSIQTVSTSLSWQVADNARLEGRVADLRFTSSAGSEQADQEDLSLLFSSGHTSWSPTLTRLSSYGGEAYQAGISVTQRLSETLDFRQEAYVGHVDKINGIDGWVYHSRTGMSFRLGSRFIALARLELERNHTFDIDARAVAYVSHFFY